eukprot:29457-Pelagococcus_subviridis.AAC.3
MIAGGYSRSALLYPHQFDSFLSATTPPVPSRKCNASFHADSPQSPSSAFRGGMSQLLCFVEPILARANVSLHASGSVAEVTGELPRGRAAAVPGLLHEGPDVLRYLELGIPEIISKHGFGVSTPPLRGGVPPPPRLQEPPLGLVLVRLDAAGPVLEVLV